MTIDPAITLGLRLRRLDGRIVATVDAATAKASGEGQRVLFLCLGRDIPEVDDPVVPDVPASRVERCVLVGSTDDPGPERTLAITSRRPGLEGRGATMTWTDPPQDAAGAEALFVPLFTDLADLAIRMEFDQEAPVTIHGSGLPFPLLSAPFRLHGATVVTADVPGIAQGPARHHLLFRPDLAVIENALSAVPDGSLVAIYEPEATDALYDFYPHVHRRGLHLVHATPGDGRTLSRQEWSMLRSALDEAAIPRVSLAQQSDVGPGPRRLDIDPDTEAFILEIEL